MHESPEAFLFEPPKPTISVNNDMLTVWIDGPIDAHMTRVRTAIRDMAMKHANEGKTITLVINSPGGAVDGIFALMEEMDLMRRDRRVRFSGIVQGIAMSAGLILLQHCDRRQMGTFGTLMAHGMTYGVRGDIKDQEVHLALTKRMTRQVAALIATRTEQVSGADTTYWFDLFHSKRCRFYSAEEARREGLIDEVIG